MAILHHLLYHSRIVAPDRADQDIADILSTARSRNSREGITGILVFSGGCFAQVLEGAPGSLAQVFEKIEADNRHIDINVLFNEPLEVRNFPDWSMGFVGADAKTSQVISATLANICCNPATTGPHIHDLMRAVSRHALWQPLV